MMKNWTERDISAAVSKISTEQKQNKDEIILKTCPYCNKSDWKFSINTSKQVFRCSHLNSCSASGTLYKLLSDMGIVSPITKSLQKEYTRPKQDPGIISTDDFYTWYSKERGICADILKRFQVGFKSIGEKRYMVYRYFDEQGQEVNRKYRNCKDKKDMWTEKGAEQVYYGVNQLDYNKPRLIVVSGEDDVHAMYQMQIDNVVSVPFGDNSYSPAMDRINAKFKEIILFFDADESGQNGAYRYGLKAGISKCKNAVLPWKDARDCLLQGLDIFAIESIIAQAKPFKCSEIITAGDTKESVIDTVFSAKYQGVMLPVREVNRILGGVRLSELSIIIAHTGSGKTTFCLNFVWWCIQAGMKALVLSFENTLESIILKLIEIKTAEQIRSYDVIESRWNIDKSKEWIKNQIDELDSKEIYFLNRAAVENDGYFDIEKLITIIEYAVKFHNVNLVMIDHLHYFLNLTAERNPTSKIDETMRKLSQVTQRLKVHTLLITHPHKVVDDKSGSLVPIGLNSAKGASSIQQEAFNFLTVAKNESESGNFACVKILKNRAIGRTGDIEFKVKPNLNTFYTDSMRIEGGQDE